MSVSKNTKTNGIVPVTDEDQCLDTTQLHGLEHAFREWADLAPRADMRFSRRRILLIFLLIRYTGAKLNEVLVLDPLGEIDPVQRVVFFRGNVGGKESGPREVQLSETISRKIQELLADPCFRDASRNMLNVDPGFVRRKFYERAQACGFSKRMGGPEMIRKARAVELMQANMPLPAVQMMLGHSTPNLTTAYVSFSEDEIRQVTRGFIERESGRRTSARNAFFGKIKTILGGDIQARVDLTTMDGHSITTVITNDSVERLGLQPGGLVMAEVKAPWVLLQKGDLEPECSAENRFKGVITRIARGSINTEYAVRISDGTQLCAIVSTTNQERFQLEEGDRVWAFFNCFAVVLHLDH
ncbi:MAG: TOBE domain-containing protein [Desulfobacterium sp.]|nr:TOBE domain-containing protein [Desulfobacterium sp.]